MFNQNPLGSWKGFQKYEWCLYHHDQRCHVSDRVTLLSAQIGKICLHWTRMTTQTVLVEFVQMSDFSQQHSVVNHGTKISKEDVCTENLKEKSNGENHITYVQYVHVAANPA